MKKNNLQNKLFESGLIEEGDTAKIEAFKKQHKLEYALEHQKEYNKKKVRKTLILTINQFSLLTEMASQYNMKLSPFMLYMIFKNMEETNIEPTDTLKKEILFVLRSIDNSFTEQCLMANFNNQIDHKVIIKNKEEVSKMVKSIEILLSNPTELSDWLTFQTQQDSMFIPKLLMEISSYLKNKK